MNRFERWCNVIGFSVAVSLLIAFSAPSISVAKESIMNSARLCDVCVTRVASPPQRWGR